MSTGLKWRIRTLERRTAGMPTASDLERFDEWLARLLQGPTPQDPWISLAPPFEARPGAGRSGRAR
jgi:hypothetical protein